MFYIDVHHLSKKVDQLNDHDDDDYRCVSHKVDHTMINKGELAIHGVPGWTIIMMMLMIATTITTLMTRMDVLANLETNSCVFSLLLRSEELGVLVT